jgi:succinate dehydrogenase / fumarate reductase flavoprotein subunit
MYQQFMELADVDITKAPMEVGPTTHYMMGGLRVDPDTAAATVPGLFAAGEAAAGLHGANRLGGNSLSDLLVFGRRAGSGAAAYAKNLASALHVNDAEVEAECRAMLAPFDRSSGANPYDVHRELQDCMDRLVGIFRTQADLEAALGELERLQVKSQGVRVEGSRMFNPGWHLARDLQNMLTVSEVITRSAMLRKESRGAHSRLDFTGVDPELGKVNFCATKTASGMNVAPTPLPTMPAELKQFFDAKPTPEKEAVR